MKPRIWQCSQPCVLRSNEPVIIWLLKTTVLSLKYLINLAFWLSAIGRAGDAPKTTFASLKFSKTMERTIETITYCFKNNGLLSSPLNFFWQKADFSGILNWLKECLRKHWRLLVMWHLLVNYRVSVKWWDSYLADNVSNQRNNEFEFLLLCMCCFNHRGENL